MQRYHQVLAVAVYLAVTISTIEAQWSAREWIPFLRSCPIHEFKSHMELRRVLTDRNDSQLLNPMATKLAGYSTNDGALLLGLKDRFRNARYKLLGKELPPVCDIPGIIGQDIAMDIIPFKVYQHLKNPSPTKPLVMFLAGPVAVGKTMTLKLLRRAVYEDSDASGDSYATTTIFATHYAAMSDSDAAERARLAKQLSRKVTEQLKKCERSIIVIDEAHDLPVEAMDAIRPFLGEEQPIRLDDTSVVSSKAIFMFTTNAAAGFIEQQAINAVEQNRGKYEMRFEEFEPLLRQEVESQFEWVGYKGLVDFCVPFLPLDRNEMSLFVERNLQVLRCKGVFDGKFKSLRWSPNLQSLVVEQVQMDQGFAKHGMRGVNTLFDRIIAEPLWRKLAEVEANKAPADVITDVFMEQKGDQVIFDVDTYVPPATTGQEPDL